MRARVTKKGTKAKVHETEESEDEPKNAMAVPDNKAENQSLLLQDRFIKDFVSTT